MNLAASIAASGIRPGRLPRAGTRSVPYWPVIALAAVFLGLELFLVPVVAGGLTYRHFRPAVKTASGLAIAALVAVLTGSLLMAVAAGIEASRALSSLYSIVVVTSGYLLVRGLWSHVAAAAPRDRHPTAAALITIGTMAETILLICGVSLAGGLSFYLMTGHAALALPTLLYPFDSPTSPEVLRYMASTRIYRADWALGSFAIPRFIYFARWDTAGAIIVGLAATLAGVKQVLTMHRFRLWLYEGLSFVLILSTLSRTVIVAHAVMSAFVFVGFARKKLVAVSILLILFVLLAYLVSFNLDLLLSFRQYSNEDRLDLYRAALDIIAAQEPLLGSGVKPKDVSQFEYAIGSHSMILSFVVRGGVVAGILGIIAFWIIPTVNLVRLASPDAAFRATWPLFLRGVAVFVLWSTFQEVDTSILSFTMIVFFLFALSTAGRARVTRSSSAYGRHFRGHPVARSE